MTRLDDSREGDPFNASEPDLSGDGADETGDESAHTAESAPEDWSYPSTSSSEHAEKKGTKQEKKRQGRERRAPDQGKSSEHGTDTTRKTAQAHASAEPRDNKRYSHLLAGVAIILIIVTELFAFLVDGCTSAISDLAGSQTDEEECLELVQERLDEVGDDEELRQQIADGFDALLIYYTDYGAEGLGLDADAYAEMVLAGFDYDLDEDSITCYDSYDDAGSVDHGRASFSITCYDSESEDSFAQEVKDYLVSEELDYYEQDELTQEQLTEVQALYEEFIDGYEMEMTWEVSLALEDQVGSDWEFDEDKLEREVAEALCNNYAEEIDLEERAEMVCRRTVTNRLDALSEDEDFHDYAASQFSEYLGDVPYDADDLGIDVDDFIDPFIDSLWYQITFVSTTDDSVKVTVAIKGIDGDVWDDFNDAVYDYLDEQDVETYRSEPLTEAQKEHIRAMYEEVVAAYDQEDQSHANSMVIELTEVGGSWTISESSYQEELNDAFSYIHY